MSKDHRFRLLDRNDADFIERFPFDDPDSLWIHDDVIEYIGATLEWIPTHNGSRPDEPQHGLNQAGETLLRSDGAAIAERVFRAWADLFAAGPPRFILTGESFTVIPDEREGPDVPADEPEPEVEPDEWPQHSVGLGTVHVRPIFEEADHGIYRFEVEREPLVAAFRRLADWSAQIAADDRLFLYHGGI